MNKEALQDQRIEIPVMFGDGRTRRISYEQIKASHSPTLVATEVLPIREDMFDQARKVQDQEHVNWSRLNQATELFDRLAVEATEAMARFGGNRWKPDTDYPEPDDERLITICHNKISTSLGINYLAVIGLLQTYQHRLEEQKDSRAKSMQENINKINYIYEQAKERTDPVVKVYPKLNAPDGFIREITFFKHEQNLSYFHLWDHANRNERNYEFYFNYEGDEIEGEPWKHFTDTYFPKAYNIACPVKPDLMEKWRQGKIDYFSDLHIDEFRDEENGRWYERRERKGGHEMIIRISYDFPDNNQTNISLHQELIALVPPKLLTDPGVLAW